MVSFAPGGTLTGELPPWEIAKAFAFHTVLKKAAEVLDTPAAELVGRRVDEIRTRSAQVRPVGFSLAQMIQQGSLSKMVFWKALN
jgi:hypothetical protein